MYINKLFNCYSRVSRAAISGLIAGGLLLSLTACEQLETAETVDGYVSRYEDQKSTDPIQSTQQLERFKVMEDSWFISNTAVPIDTSFPDAFYRPVDVFSLTPATLAEMIEIVSRITGFSWAASITAPGGEVPDSASSSDYLAIDPTTEIEDATSELGRFPYRYKGDVKGFLDYIALTFDVSYKLRNGILLIEAYHAHTIEIPGIHAELSASGAAGDSYEYSGFEFIMETVESLLGPEGVIQGNPALGTITVYDRPSVITRIEDFVSRHAEKLKRQIIMNVTIIRYTRNNDENYGLSWQDVLLSSGDNSINFSGGATVASTGSIQANATFGNFSAESIIGLLSRRGEAIIDNSVQFVALNGVPIPVDLTTSRSYISKTSVTTTDGVTEKSVDVDSVTTGMQLAVWPKLQSDNRIALSVSLSLDELISLEDFDTSSGDSIKVPETAQSVVRQHAILDSGTTWILGGFKTNDFQYNRSSVGNVPHHLLGGSTTKSESITELLVVVTPTLLNDLK